MFTTGLQGLGMVVTVTPRFDPTKIRVRLAHYIDVAAEEMTKQARRDIEASGMLPGEGDSGMWRGQRRGLSAREAYRQQAINTGMSNVVSWSSSIPMPKTPSMAKTYGMMAAKMIVGIAFPWVGIGMAVSSLFMKKKKKTMAIPWNAIYAAAVPYAQDMTKAEELQRIADETHEIEVVRQKVMEQRSAEAAAFKLPEGVTSISRGALVMALKGSPVETRIGVKK